MSEREAPDFSETTLSSEIVFRGKLLSVVSDRVLLPDGAESIREYIHHPGASMVLAFVDAHTLLLERQFRYPHRREFIEIPAGKLEPGEPHLDTAKRELLEETGYVAAEWTRVGVIHTAIAYTDEAIHLYLARKLTLKERRLDQGEFLETLVRPFDEALRMIRDGEITDAKSVAGLLWVHQFAAK